MKKEILVELCKYLQNMLNIKEQLSDKPSHKVELFSGLKPANYFIPQMHFGTSKTISQEIELAYFVEIFVDQTCIFRECTLPKEKDDLKTIEEMVCLRLLNDVFCYGIMSSIENYAKYFTPSQKNIS